MNFNNLKISQQKWRKFKQEQAILIETSGIPLDYLKNEKLWIDFLMHGYIDHHEDKIGFTVDNLNSKEYKNFTKLIDLYFESGFDYFTPMALSTNDEQKSLEEKYSKK